MALTWVVNLKGFLKMFLHWTATQYLRAHPYLHCQLIGSLVHIQDPLFIRTGI